MSLRSLTTGMRGTEGQDIARDAPPGVSRGRRSRVAVIAAAMLLVVLLAWAGTAWVGSEVTASRSRISLATVERGPFVRDLAARGTVVAAVSPTLFASAQGTVSYLAKAGDRVSAGQVIAKLDSPALVSEYEQERATLAGVEAGLARQAIEVRRQLLASRQASDVARVQIQAAERELKRAEASWAIRVISQRDYDRARDELSTAKLTFDHALSTGSLERDSLQLDLKTRRLERDRQALVVERLRQRVDALQVRSPVAGVVATLVQTERANVAQDAPLVTVVDLSVLEIEFQVAEVYAGDVRSGMQAEVTVEGRTAPAVVTSISPDVRQGQVSGRVRFSGNAPDRLRQNQRAAVRIVLDERGDVLTVKRGAFAERDAKLAYVLRDDALVRVPAEFGPAAIERVEVLSGLQAGDQIVVSDTQDFKNAERIALGH
jgi:HlyD family secretion protein